MSKGNESAKIKLLTGEAVLVDSELLKYLNEYRWFRSGNDGRYYAYARIGGKKVAMHRLIMSAKGGQYVDHRNHNTLDNRRSNLRLCTPAESNMNRRTFASSGLKGVYSIAGTSLYESKLVVDGKTRFLGRYRSKLSAALVYDFHAKKHFKKFAVTNDADGIIAAMEAKNGG